MIWLSERIKLGELYTATSEREEAGPHIHWEDTPNQDISVECHVCADWCSYPGFR